MKNNEKIRLVLASGSPRRREILNSAGYGFILQRADVDETIPENVTSDKAALYLAELKNKAVAKNDGRVYLTADTVVVCDKKILGKPKDKADAEKMLGLLSGRSHFVYTGVCVSDSDKKISFQEKTEVFFYPLSDSEINCYAESGEPLDKAGAYGIQGKAALFVEKIDGDYLNVVGLPLARLSRTLAEFGIYPE